MHQAATVRIVVASPGDVQAERNVMATVVEEIKHGIARDRGWNWRDGRRMPIPDSTPRGRRG